MTSMGHVKRNPTTGVVAVRTHFDESIVELAPMAWATLNPITGTSHATSAEVESWDDLFIPEPEE